METQSDDASSEEYFPDENADYIEAAAESEVSAVDSIAAPVDTDGDAKANATGASVEPERPEEMYDPFSATEAEAEAAGYCFDEDEAEDDRAVQAAAEAMRQRDLMLSLARREAKLASALEELPKVPASVVVPMDDRRDNRDSASADRPPPPPPPPERQGAEAGGRRRESDPARLHDDRRNHSKRPPPHSRRGSSEREPTRLPKDRSWSSSDREQNHLISNEGRSNSERGPLRKANEDHGWANSEREPRRPREARRGWNNMSDREWPRPQDGRLNHSELRRPHDERRSWSNSEREQPQPRDDDRSWSDGMPPRPRDDEIMRNNGMPPRPRHERRSWSNGKPPQHFDGRRITRDNKEEVLPPGDRRRRLDDDVEIARGRRRRFDERPEDDVPRIPIQSDPGGQRGPASNFSSRSQPVVQPPHMPPFRRPPPSWVEPMAEKGSREVRRQFEHNYDDRERAPPRLLMDDRSRNKNFVPPHMAINRERYPPPPFHFPPPPPARMHPPPRQPAPTFNRQLPSHPPHHRRPSGY